MSTTLAEPLFKDVSRKLGRTGATPDRNGSDGGGLTLQRRLDDVWEGLHADGAAECPVCSGTLSRSGDGDAAHCGTCGTQLTAV